MTPDGTAEDFGIDDLMIGALLAGASYVAAAEAAGVSKSTVQRRMKEPEFRARLATERAEMLRQVRDRIGTAAAGAVSVLASVMNDARESGAVRTRAARALLDLTQRFTEELPLPEPPQLGEECPTCWHTEPTPEQQKESMDSFVAELDRTAERLEAAGLRPGRRSQGHS